MGADVKECDCTQGCLDTRRESALKVNSGRKIPCHIGKVGFNLCVCVCVYVYVFLYVRVCVLLLTPVPPKGGWRCLMSSPCPRSQGCHLIPHRYLLPHSSA